MRKRFFAMFLIVVLLIAAFGLSCEPTEKGTIEVEATLDGDPWTGAVDYTLTRTGETINGDSVDKTFSVAPDTWTCAYVSGGPGSFVDITPSDTQSVAASGTITFTLNFVTPTTPVDASIEFETWTINGTPVAPGWYLIGPNTIVDIRYKEHVSGEQGATVTINQTAWIQVHNIGIWGEMAGPNITLHCVNAPDAVKMSPQATKLYQQATVEGVPVQPCTNTILEYCKPVKLDAEVGWELVVCNNYTKTINWIGIPSPADIVFDVTDPYNALTLNLTAKACIGVGEGFEDIDPANDCTDWCPPLVVTYLIP